MYGIKAKHAESETCIDSENVDVAVGDYASCSWARDEWHVVSGPKTRSIGDIWCFADVGRAVQYIEHEFSQVGTPYGRAVRR